MSDDDRGAAVEYCAHYQENAGNQEHFFVAIRPFYLHILRLGSSSLTHYLLTFVKMKDG